MAKPSDLPVDQRREAVLALLRKEEPAKVVAGRNGIAEVTLFRWKEEFLTAGENSLARKSSSMTPEMKRIKELESKVAERERVIGELTIANRILKQMQDGKY
jgi:transposase